MTTPPDTTTAPEQAGSLDRDDIRVLERQIEDALLADDRVADCAVVFQGVAVDSVPAERCVRCGMDAAYPGTRLDRDGVCDLCLMYAENGPEILAYFGEVEEFTRVLRERAEAAGSGFDALLLFSGGKDSTYVLHQLVRMGLRVMTFTFDNGFISRTALENVETITKSLGIEHVTMTRADQNRVFLRSLEQHKSVCNGCFRSLLDLSHRLAHERGIPSIVTGLSRGQIIDERLLWFYRNGEFDPARIEQQLEVGRKVYHQVGSDLSDGMLDSVEVVDYYRYSDVTKDDIRAFLAEAETLWAAPKDTGFCSSNCMINDVGVYVHRLERGYHNYESPTRWEVRLGHLSRAEADAELRTPVNTRRVRSMLATIGYTDPGDRSRLGRRMAAYYVPRTVLPPDQLRASVAARLPEILLPEHWVEVAELPRTADGAVDRKALPDPAPGTGRRLAPDTAEAQAPVGAPDAGRPTPAQRLLLEQDGAGPDGRARALLLDLPEATTAENVRKAVLALVQRHEALRARFSRKDGGWRREVAGLTGGVPVAALDLTRYEPTRVAGALRVAAERLRARLDVARGPLFAAAFVERREAEPQLLLIVHELAVDVEAWRRLLDDLGTALGRIAAGGSAGLPAAPAPRSAAEPADPPPAAGKLWAPPAVERDGPLDPVRHTVLEADRTAALAATGTPLAALVATAVTHGLAETCGATGVLLAVTDHTGALIHPAGLFAVTGVAGAEAGAGAALTFERVRSALDAPVTAPAGAVPVGIAHLGDLDGLPAAGSPLRHAGSADHDLAAPFGVRLRTPYVVSYLRDGCLHLDWVGTPAPAAAADAAAAALAQIAATASEGAA
ncbi:7-cyano-7-deazaguanine synthase [Streptomyces sp. JJ66]|uniref:condensation domain-containing protein n=1 Tax=Streptomyces sp. JJ66 TaxID=2803843 RepID=UPI001C58E457|nr:condensation domain-containing protein [Streptomyces sp. JJ66]MBW1600738.1 7-cyano-7-deazaguanine synthase [Streptomyces sp. JJ66]